MVRNMVPSDLIESLGHCIEIVRKQPGVGVESERGREVPKHPLDGFDVRARGDSKARGRVAEVVRSERG